MRYSEGQNVATNSREYVNLLEIGVDWQALTTRNILCLPISSFNDYREIIEEVYRGNIVPDVDSVYPLGQTREAYVNYEPGEQFGKIVLEIIV